MAKKFEWKDENIIKLYFPKWDNYLVDDRKYLNSDQEQIIRNNSIFVMFTWRDTVDKKSIQDEVVDGVEGFFIAYVVVVVFCALLVSFDGVGDLLGNLGCSLSCISNVGPYLTSGLGRLDGASFASYSSFSKVIFTLEMIAGRLELFPILILLNPRTWKKRSF